MVEVLSRSFIEAELTGLPLLLLLLLLVLVLALPLLVKVHVGWLFSGGVKITTTGLQILFPPRCRDKGTRYLVTGLQFLFVPCCCCCRCYGCACCCFPYFRGSLKTHHLAGFCIRDPKTVNVDVFEPRQAESHGIIHDVFTLGANTWLLYCFLHFCCKNHWYLRSFGHVASCKQLHFQLFSLNKCGITVTMFLSCARPKTLIKHRLQMLQNPPAGASR